MRFPQVSSSWLSALRSRQEQPQEPHELTREEAGPRDSIALDSSCPSPAGSSRSGSRAGEEDPALPTSRWRTDRALRGRQRFCACWEPLVRTPRRRCILVLSIVVFVIALALGLGLGLYFGLQEQEDPDSPVVDLGYARYRGTDLANGVSQYLGMRYARPPTGDLRWRAPTEPETHEQIQNAKKFGPVCLGNREAPSDSLDEDCLFVNVWAPHNATPDLKLPVMVFIQGGGYTRNANANWNGTRLMETSENDLVFVNFNYRVGIWGFLAGEEVSADGDLNVGLLDQRFLLHWVQVHISQFGGDPDRVVIQGASAGAGSVALHLSAYGGRDDGLFHAAIAESTFMPAHPDVSELEHQLDHVMGQAGCGDAEGRMTCLRERSMKELQALNVPSPFPGRQKNPLFAWTPCIDGDFLVDIPSVLFKEGRFVNVPILAGTCTNEGSVFAANASSEGEVVTFLQDNYPNLPSNRSTEILNHYPLESRVALHNSWFPSASRAYGEATFICPTNRLLNAVYNRSQSTQEVEQAPTRLWSYRYNVFDEDEQAKGHGVPHVLEVGAVFGPDMLSYSAPSSYFTYNADAVPLVMGYFLSFARTLDPNVHRIEGAPEWKPWNDNQSRIVLQTTDTAMETVDNDERQRCDFWKDLATDMNH